MSKYKNRIIASIIVIFILLAAFVFGGNIPEESAPIATPAPTLSANTPLPSPEPTLQAKKPEETLKPQFTSSPTSEPAHPRATQTPSPTTEPYLEDKLTCTISITCHTVLSNMSFLSVGKQDIIPEDGVILAEKTAVFYEDESVFNVLAREARQNNIHLEFVNVPFYNSAYIEGISNLYEFDCGELSGWMYKVNGEFPRFGSSQYTVKNGDKIEWVYTCNSGADVGDSSGTRNGFGKAE